MRLVSNNVHLFVRRTIGRSLLSLVCLPLTPFIDAWEEGRGIVLRWQHFVVERHRQVSDFVGACCGREDER